MTASSDSLTLLLHSRLLWRSLPKNNFRKGLSAQNPILGFQFLQNIGLSRPNSFIPMPGPTNSHINHALRQNVVRILPRNANATPPPRISCPMIRVAQVWITYLQALKLPRQVLQRLQRILQYHLRLRNILDGCEETCNTLIFFFRSPTSNDAVESSGSRVRRVVPTSEACLWGGRCNGRGTCGRRLGRAL